MNCIQDGLFNETLASEGGYLSHWGYRSNLNDYPQVRHLRHGGIALIGSTEEWHIVRLVSDEEKIIVTIRHVHHKSQLVCSTDRVDKYRWMCNTCGEQVPHGILFAAITMKIEVMR